MELHEAIARSVTSIYPSSDADALTAALIMAMDIDPAGAKRVAQHTNLWSEQDAVLVTYGNSVNAKGEAPLETVTNIFAAYFSSAFNIVHLLPFFPFSSDEGFSVVNYLEVNQSLGDWQDIERLTSITRVMADLVINHVSSRSIWFDQFKRGELPGRDYFITPEDSEDLSAVVRPRTTPLLTEVQTRKGLRKVWTTFGPDQVDLNFSNPAVLLEMVKVIRYYLDRGIDVFRLDAIAFLWKQAGTSSINRPETHELVRLLRTLIEHKQPKSWLITETNLPNDQNLSYFGNSNEAHLIYNFSLPPLLLQGLLAGTSDFLNRWMMSMPPARDGTAYLNFIASHDGIGLRPAEGILDEAAISGLVQAVLDRHGRVSWREVAGEPQPYELNISLYDAFGEVHGAEDEHQMGRFVLAHTIMMGLEGVPAFYIHSLFGTQNDYRRAEALGHNRAINRHLWQQEALEAALANETLHHGKVMRALLQRLQVRQMQPAFHPNATQYTLLLGSRLFAFWRQSRDREQSIFCVHNLTKRVQHLSIDSLNLIVGEAWHDLLSDEPLREGTTKLTLFPYQAVWLTNWF